MRFNTNNLFFSSKILKAFAFIVVITFLNVLATAKTSFNDNLDEENRRKLGNGEVVILNTGNTKKICLDTDNPIANKLIQTMKNLKPAYFSEVIQIKPYKGNEDLIDRIEKELLDVPGYAGIPYYSVRHDKWYKLYESAEIKSKSNNGNKTNMVADVVMKPFGLFTANISLEKNKEDIFYLFTNSSKMILEEKLTAAGPEKMKSGIAVYRDGDNWILYGAGGVDALSIFFLRDRIETSFINRIKSFTVYFINKVDNKTEA